MGLNTFKRCLNDECMEWCFLKMAVTASLTPPSPLSEDLHTLISVDERPADVVAVGFQELDLR